MKKAIFILLVSVACNSSKSDSDTLAPSEVYTNKVDFQLMNYQKELVTFSLESSILSISDTTSNYYWSKRVNWEGDSTRIEIEISSQSEYEFIIYLNEHHKKTFKSDTSGTFSYDLIK